MMQMIKLTQLPALLLVVLLSGLGPVACGEGSSGFDYSKPDAIVVAIHTAVKEDKPILVWNGLPSAWRTDINGLIREFGSKVDEKAYDSVMKTARLAVGILADKKTFILNSAMGQMFMQGMQQSLGEQVELVTENYDLIVTMLKTVVESDLGTAEGLKRCDLGLLIGKYGPELMRLNKAVADLDLPGSEMKELREALASAEGMTAKVDSMTGDEATITLIMPGRPDQPTQMKKVGNRWVPAGMAAQMPMMMAMAKSELAGMDMTELNDSLKLAQAMLPMVDKAMEPLEAAKTQEEFDQGVMQMMMMMGTAMQSQE
ncbi:MAG: hypothetical protein CMJ39_05950 [Phycisphaerae bacterium]|nr:hypothetical protein [Phycisphaerae bacterium]